MLRIAILTLLLTCRAAFSQEAPRHDEKPNEQPTQPPAPDQRGSETIPFVVKILPAPQAEQKPGEEEQERKHKATIEDKVAFETQRIADYTWWLALFTLVVFAVGIIQAGLFLWQLILIRRGADEATVAANAVRDAAKAAADQATIARNAFIAAHRPRVIARRFMYDGLVPDEPIRIEYEMVNRGDPNGYILENTFDAWFKKTAPGKGGLNSSQPKFQPIRLPWRVAFPWRLSADPPNLRASSRFTNIRLANLNSS